MAAVSGSADKMAQLGEAPALHPNPAGRRKEPGGRAGGSGPRARRLRGYPRRRRHAIGGAAAPSTARTERAAAMRVESAQTSRGNGAERRGDGEEGAGGVLPSPRAARQGGSVPGPGTPNDRRSHGGVLLLLYWLLLIVVVVVLLSWTSTERKAARLRQHAHTAGAREAAGQRSSVGETDHCVCAHAPCTRPSQQRPSCSRHAALAVRNFRGRRALL